MSYQYNIEWFRIIIKLAHTRKYFQKTYFPGYLWYLYFEDKLKHYEEGSDSQQIIAKGMW